MIYSIVNSVGLAVATSSASTSALVVPSGLIRIASTTNAFFTITSSAGTADNTGTLIGAGEEVIIKVDNGSFLNAIRDTANGRISVSCVRPGNPLGE